MDKNHRSNVFILLVGFYDRYLFTWISVYLLFNKTKWQTEYLSIKRNSNLRVEQCFLWIFTKYFIVIVDVRK